MDRINMVKIHYWLISSSNTVVLPIRCAFRHKLLFIAKTVLGIPRPTKSAPDAGDSAAISSSFPRLIIFLAGRLRRPRPNAGNANRWLAEEVAHAKILYNK